MKIQIEQNKQHRKHMSIAQEFTVSFTLINLVLQYFTNRKNLNTLGRNSNYQLDVIEPK